MQATTVSVVWESETLTELNCGFISRAEGVTAIVIAGHSLMFSGPLADPLEAAQKFADLIADVTA